MLPLIWQVVTFDKRINNDRDRREQAKKKRGGVEQAIFGSNSCQVKWVNFYDKLRASSLSSSNLDGLLNHFGRTYSKKPESGRQLRDEKELCLFNGNSAGRDGSAFTALDLSVQFVIPNVVYRAACSSCQKCAFSGIDCAI